MDISWGRKKSLVKDMNARDGMEQAISQRLQRRAWKQGWHGKGAGGRWGPRAEADFPAESENSMFCVSQALGWEQIPLPSSPQSGRPSYEWAAWDESQGQTMETGRCLGAKLGAESPNQGWCAPGSMWGVLMGSCGGEGTGLRAWRVSPGKPSEVS